MKWTNTKIHVPCQAITDNTEFFLVARLIKDKADASSTVNQLKRDMRVVCMKLKFDPKYKSAVFSAKYLKSEIEFEGHYLLSVCCVFAAFPSFGRPFGAIFCLTVDATSPQSKATST